METSVFRGLYILWCALYGYFQALFFLKVVFIEKDFFREKDKPGKAGRGT